MVDRLILETVSTPNQTISYSAPQKLNEAPKEVTVPSRVAKAELEAFGV
jgi:hypothetical protein